MPWSDNSDDGDVKPKPGSKPGPWGAPPAPGGSGGGPDAGKGSDTGAKPPRASPKPPRGDDSEAPRKPSGAPPPRKPPTPPTPDDLTIMLRRLRQQLEDRLKILITSGALPWMGAVAIGAGAALWLASGLYIVKPGEQGVVTTFGAYSRTAQPGPNYHLPAPIERVDVVATTALKSFDVGAGADVDPRSLMLTSDQNIISINFTVQYRITDPRAYLFNIKDADATLQAAAEGAIRQAVGRRSYPQITTTDHAPIQSETRAAMQAALDRYEAGVTITGVQINATNPPREVAAEAQKVAAARLAAQAEISDASGHAAKAAGEARGAAAKAILDAQAYSAKTVNEAQGEADRFNEIDQEYRRAPGVTKQRLYIETMERVLARTNKVIIDAHGSNTTIALPPEAFRTRGPSIDATTQPAAPGGVQ
jgi:membrane protease subunit HflK